MSINSTLKADVWNKTGGKCVYCGRQTIPYGRYKNSFQVDHLWPQCRGGKDNIENLVPACAFCNLEKNDHHFTEYMAIKTYSTNGWGAESEDFDIAEAKKDPLYQTWAEYMVAK